MERKGLRPRFAAYVIVAFWTAAIIVFGVVERLVDPRTFHSIWLGMWWATQTVTTVGYGDIVPQQTIGKIIAVFLMLGGLSLLAVVTGAITSAFVTRAEAERRDAGDDLRCGPCRRLAPSSRRSKGSSPGSNRAARVELCTQRGETDEGSEVCGSSRRSP